MEQNNQNPQNNQQPAQPQCSGNCLQCFPAQRQYCASQHALSNMRVLDKVMETLGSIKEQIATMQGSIEELAVKIEAIQDDKGTVFDPNGGGELFPKEFAKDPATE